MIRHQHIDVNIAFSFIGKFFKPLQVSLVIFIGIKASYTVVAALDNVLRDVGEDNTGAGTAISICND
jgi:hypothetical protein